MSLGVPSPPLLFTTTRQLILRYYLWPLLASAFLYCHPTSLLSISRLLCVFYWLRLLILFPPSFLFLSFVVGATRLPPFVVCGGGVHWLLVLALPFSNLSCMAVFSGSLSRFPIVHGVLSLLGCVAVILFFSPLLPCALVRS